MYHNSFSVRATSLNFTVMPVEINTTAVDMKYCMQYMTDCTQNTYKGGRYGGTSVCMLVSIFCVQQRKDA